MSGGSAGSAQGSGTVKLLVVCGILLAAAVAADIATAAWSVRERVLLALVAVLAVIAGLLLRRDRLTDQRLAAERRQLSIAVNNIPQGLVLYDASARIIICNQPYLDMFGLSPDVAKPGCTMQRLIAHRKETGSFDGDVDEFCNAIIHNGVARQGDAAAHGSAGRPGDRDHQPAAEGRRMGRDHRGHHRAQARRREDRASGALRRADRPAEPGPVPRAAGTVAQGDTAGRATGGALYRHRRVQERQRRARPSDRRRAAQGRRRAPARLP